LDALVFPAAGYTRRHVIDYYVRVAPDLLPHLKDRPVALKRYSGGGSTEARYERDAPASTPDWVRTVPVQRQTGGPGIRSIVVDDLATLVWCAELDAIEFDTFLHRAANLDRPSAILFDLDPGEGAGMLDCAEVALLIRESLRRAELDCFVKSSGSKGLQIHVPLNTVVSYDMTRQFARRAALSIEREHPGLASALPAKAKVFIDWRQNSDFKTSISVYSLRAGQSYPFVSIPFTWEELGKACVDRDKVALYSQPQAALARLEAVGDLFVPVLGMRQDLPENLAETL
jgi:bifunctional non-homologous end joining protein LigD